jgi:hypothetical protein
MRFDAEGTYTVTLTLDYRVGLSTFLAQSEFSVEVLVDSDGDGVPDRDDPFPDDPSRCGDADDDGCDDCDVACEPGGGEGDGGGCCQTGGGPAGPALLALLLLVAGRKRSR